MIGFTLLVFCYLMYMYLRMYPKNKIQYKIKPFENKIFFSKSINSIVLYKDKDSLVNYLSFL